LEHPTNFGELYRAVSILVEDTEADKNLPPFSNRNDCGEIAQLCSDVYWGGIFTVLQYSSDSWIYISIQFERSKTHAGYLKLNR
jgi:hypothetical protein